jgi:6,7-dimethyl-8-ribityllumazine synthase
MQEDPIRVLIVEGRFYSDLSDEMLAGAKSALEAYGAEYDVITVPGALEIPAVIAIADEAGRGPAGVFYDGYVALGVVIRGETYHFEIVSNETARGIMDLVVNRKLAIGNGVLTVEDEEQAWARARVSEGDKGGGAAHAALEVIAIKRRLQGQGQ